MFHTCYSTCIQCTASDRFSQPPSSLEWTADMKGDLRMEIIWSFGQENQKKASRWKCVCLFVCFTRTTTVWAGHKLFRLTSFLVQVGISQTEITVVVWQSQTIWALLWSCPRERARTENTYITSKHTNFSIHWKWYNPIQSLETKTSVQNLVSSHVDGILRCCDMLPM